MGHAYADELIAMAASDIATGRGMRFVDEYRDPVAARALVSRIIELAGDQHVKFMEVCGSHTHTIYRHGIEHLLPQTVELVHGPGCRVCEEQQALVETEGGGGRSWLGLRGASDKP